MLNDWATQYRICCDLHNKEKALEIWHQWLRERSAIREVVIPMPVAETAPITAHKLTREMAVEIYSLRGKRSYKEISEKFGISYQTISNIFKGRTWREATKSEAA